MAEAQDSGGKPGVVRKWFYSLKKRLIVTLLLCAIVPLVLIGSISYYSIISILENKIQSSMHNNLARAKMSLDYTLSNLNHVSQQLAFNGKIGNDMAKYLESAAILEKQRLEQDIQNNLHLIGFTNPGFGLALYYDADTNKAVIGESISNGRLETSRLNKLFENNGMTYYGPHRTMNRFIDRTVLSVTRPVAVPGYDNLYIYVETNFQIAQNILNADKSGMHVTHLIVDQDNSIVYSENQQYFNVGSTYVPSRDSDMMKMAGHYLFEEADPQGWRIVATVPEADYNAEKNNWIMQFAGFAVISLGVALVLAGIIWRTVNRPMRSVNKEIRQLQQGNFHSPLKHTKIIEFDALLDQLQRMRLQIVELLQEVKTQEKQKSELEVEKLLFQINPHFIHNTLDTIRWMARSQGYLDIDNLIFTLNRVLYYNMGKGGASTIRMELEALMDYVSLQRIRYDFEFDVRVLAADEIMELAIPRFVLQPLVENSLYHGFMDNGVIEVSISLENGRYTLIQVTDNGEGMAEEDVARLMHAESREDRKVGMGIGIHYVHRMMKAQFGAEASLQIASKLGAGTTMTLRIPIQR